MKSDINVTPLVDIVLVLLIIFIVITPAVNSAVRLPAARHSVRPERDGVRYLTLILAAHRNADGAVDGPGPVAVDGRSGDGGGFSLADPAARQRLVAYVQQSVARLDDRRVFIKADLGLPFKYVDELLQICREAGADEASMVTRSDQRAGQEGD